MREVGRMPSQLSFQLATSHCLLSASTHCRTLRQSLDVSGTMLAVRSVRTSECNNPRTKPAGAAPPDGEMKLDGKNYTPCFFPHLLALMVTFMERCPRLVTWILGWRLLSSPPVSFSPFSLPPCFSLVVLRSCPLPQPLLQERHLWFPPLATW